MLRRKVPLEDVFVLVVPVGSTARTTSTDAGASMSGEVQCSTSPYVLVWGFTKAFCSVIKRQTECAATRRNRRVVLIESSRSQVYVREAPGRVDRDPGLCETQLLSAVGQSVGRVQG